MNKSWPSIDELRVEFRDHGLSGALWDLIAQDLILHGRARIVPRYNPRVYSPSGAWDDEGLRDLVHDFMVMKGIEKGAVLAGLQKADNTVGFIYFLEKSFRNFVVSQRQRTIADNLYRRLIDALAEDPQLVPLAGMSTRAAYGLDEWQDNPPECLGDGDMRSAVRALPQDVRTLIYDSGARQSPLIQASELQRISRAVISGTGRLVTAKQLMQLLKARFGMELAPEEAQLESVEGILEIADSQPLQRMIADELAGALFKRLSARQRLILRELIEKDPPPSVRDIAASLGISKSAVQRERQAITDAIVSLDVLEPHEQSQVLIATAQLLGQAS